MVTISDKKLYYSSNGTTVDFYLPDVISATGIYNGGMVQPGRSFSASKYQFSINGQLKTNEIAPNTTSAEFWEYDSRLIRRWNVEPEIQKYPGFSSYLVYRNNPISYSDPDGKDVIILTWVTTKGDPGHTVIAIRDYKEVKIKVHGKWKTVHSPKDTYTLYELGPLNPLPHSEAAFKNSFTPNYNPVYGVTYDELMNNKRKEGGRVTKYDGFPSEGAVKILTDGYKEDKTIRDKMEAKIDEGKFYNTVTNNCTSYCSDVIPTPTGKKIDATETFEYGSKYTMATPIKLYTEIIKLGPEKVVRLRVIPENLIKNIEQAYTTNPKRGESPKKQ